MESELNKVFINGAFDIIHVGHIRLIERATKLGAVIIGINSDISIKRLKGPNRPINSHYDRYEVLKAIKGVNSVFIFDSDNCSTLIREVKPNIIVKGSDYSLENIHPEELAAAREVGAVFQFFPRQEGYSSTNIIEKMKNE